MNEIRQEWPHDEGFGPGVPGARDAGEAAGHMLAEELKTAIQEARLRLAQADESIAAMSRLLPRLAGLGSFIRDLEALIGSVRGQLAVPAASAGPADSRIGIPTQPAPADSGAATAPIGSMRDQFAGPPAVAGPADAGLPAPTRLAPADPGAATASSPERRHRGHRLRLLAVASADRLDLGDLEERLISAFGPNPLELIDYDGRKATLEIWADSQIRARELLAAWNLQAAEDGSGRPSLTLVALEDAA